MQTARDITAVLGGKWHQGYGMVRCPAHDDKTPSCKVWDGEDEILVHCFAGCEWRAIKDALRERGLMPELPIYGKFQSFSAPRKPTQEPDKQRCALEIWKGSTAAPGTSAETYLRGRGVALPIPPTIKFYPSLKHSPTGLSFEAMIAAIQAPDRSVVAIHRTYLQADGQGKAKVLQPKMALGPIGSGAVRLGPAGPALGLTEGIETGLSAMQLFEIPVWVALGSSLERPEIPSEVIEVQIFGDNGDPGHDAAERAAQVHTAKGRRVAVRYPPELFGDWNDALSALEGTWTT